MIPKLIAYAERNIQQSSPGFAPRSAKFVLLCDAKNGADPVESDFSVSVLGNENDKKNQGIEFEQCPETPGMNSGGKSHLLLETVDVVLV